MNQACLMHHVWKKFVSNQAKVLVIRSCSQWVRRASVVKWLRVERHSVWTPTQSQTVQCWLYPGQWKHTSRWPPFQHQSHPFPGWLFQPPKESGEQRDCLVILHQYLGSYLEKGAELFQICDRSFGRKKTTIVGKGTVASHLLKFLENTEMSATSTIISRNGTGSAMLQYQCSKVARLKTGICDIQSAI